MKSLKISLISLLALAFVLGGCKKKDDENIEPAPQNDTTGMVKSINDEDLYTSSTDDILEDVGKFLNEDNLKGTQDLPCNTVLDSTIIQNDTMIFYLTFNGLNCNNTMYRDGQLVVRTDMSAIWPQEGAVIHVHWIDFKVTRVSNGHWVIIDGYHDYTNVSGGYLIHLGNGLDTIIHHVDGTVNLTFMNNSTRNWNVAREKVFTGSAGEFVRHVSGYGTADGYDNLVVWGVNRQGNAFYTQVTLPIERRQECLWQASAGVSIHQIPSLNQTFTITYGFDANNNPIQPGECAEKFRLDWELNNTGGYIYLWL